MVRTRVRRLAATALVAVAATGVLAAGHAAGSAEPPGRGEHSVRHVVRPGDTLWELARIRVGPEGDPRPLIEALRSLNGLGTGSLQPGTTIVIPPAP